MKHFKFKTAMKLTGYRAKGIQGIAFTEKRLTADQATMAINERVSAMVKEDLKKAGKLPEEVINSIKFETKIENLTVDVVCNLDEPVTMKKVSPEGAAAPSGE